MVIEPLRKICQVKLDHIKNQVGNRYHKISPNHLWKHSTPSHRCFPRFLSILKAPQHWWNPARWISGWLTFVIIPDCWAKSDTQQTQSWGYSLQSLASMLTNNKNLYPIWLFWLVNKDSYNWLYILMPITRVSKPLHKLTNQDLFGGPLMNLNQSPPGFSNFWQAVTVDLKKDSTTWARHKTSNMFPQTNMVLVVCKWPMYLEPSGRQDTRYKKLGFLIFSVLHQNINVHFKWLQRWHQRFYLGLFFIVSDSSEKGCPKLWVIKILTFQSG